jgi:HEAT repeat protein
MPAPTTQLRFQVNESSMTDSAYGDDPIPQEEIDRQIDHWAKRLNSRFQKTRREGAKRLEYLCNEHQERASRAAAILVHCLDNRDEEIRERGIRGLNDLGAGGSSALFDCLKSEKKLTVLSAVRAFRIRADRIADAAPHLLELLQHSDLEVRIAAFGAIPYQLPPAVEILSHVVRGFTSVHSTERAAAIASAAHLGKCSETSVILTPFRDALLEAQSDADLAVRCAAFEALEYCEMTPAERFCHLREALNQESKFSFSAIKSIAELADQFDCSFAAAKLIPSIHAVDSLNREVCKLLGKFGPAAKGAAPYLRPWLDGIGDDDFDRGSSSILAAETLWKIEGNPEYILPRLAELLDNYEGYFDEHIPDLVYHMGPAAEPLASRMVKILLGEHYDPAWAAANALEKIASKDSEIIRALVDALGQKSSIVSDAAVRALVATGPIVIPFLTEGMKKKEGVHLEWIMDALSQFEELSVEALPEIRKRLHDQDEYLRIWSAIAIAKISADPSVIPELISILETADGEKFRMCAAEGLMKLGPAAAQALPALRQNLNHESDFARHAAAKAILCIENSVDPPNPKE